MNLTSVYPPSGILKCCILYFFWINFFNKINGTIQIKLKFPFFPFIAFLFLILPFRENAYYEFSHILPVLVLYFLYLKLYLLKK